jgi:hypothetical protein
MWTDAFIAIFTCLDVFSQCIFELMLVRNVKIFTAKDARMTSDGSLEEGESMLHPPQNL